LAGQLCCFLQILEEVLLADSVEKVGPGFRDRKVRV
jgi:hypothetical protein